MNQAKIAAYLGSPLAKRIEAAIRFSAPTQRVLRTLPAGVMAFQVRIGRVLRVCLPSSRAVQAANAITGGRKFPAPSVEDAGVFHAKYGEGSEHGEED